MSKRTPGRPKTAKPWKPSVHVTIEPSIIEVVDRLAREGCRNRSLQVEYLLRQALIQSGDLRADGKAVL